MDQWSQCQRMKDGATFQFAGKAIQVIYTPGHTMDLICYYIPEDGVILWVIPCLQWVAASILKALRK